MCRTAFTLYPVAVCTSIKGITFSAWTTPKVAAKCEIAARMQNSHRNKDHCVHVMTTSPGAPWLHKYPIVALGGLDETRRLGRLLSDVLPLCYVCFPGNSSNAVIREKIHNLNTVVNTDGWCTHTQTHTHTRSLSCYVNKHPHQCVHRSARSCSWSEARLHPGYGENVCVGGKKGVMFTDLLRNYFSSLFPPLFSTQTHTCTHSPALPFGNAIHPFPITFHLLTFF